MDIKEETKNQELKELDEKEEDNIEIQHEDTKKSDKIEIKEQEKEDIKEKQEESKKKKETEKESISQKQQPDKELIVKKSSLKTRLIWGGIIGGLLVIVLLLLSTIFALVNVNNINILKGIFVEGIDLSGLSREETRELLEETFNERLSNDILLKYEEFETTINPEQIAPVFNIDKAVSDAYEIGRNSNIIVNNYNILGAMLFNKNIEADLQYNQEELEKLIIDISAKIPNTLIETSYYIEEDELIITKGQKGISIKEKEFESLIIDVIRSGKLDKLYVEIPVEMKEPQKIDIETIYAEVVKEPQNAYIEPEPFKIYSHVEGIDFAISIEEARAILQEDKEEYVIPLKRIVPEITIDKLGAEAFPHLLGSYSTKFDESNKNRSNNIRLASAKIDGVVLMPGDIFSYNKIVGERTISAGYKEAAVYSNGQVVDGIGGGICQVSSTLYNAVLYANLEIVERYNHYFLPSYITAGRDATVSYGTVDFQFKNSRDYPVKIMCTASNGISKIEVFGIQEEVEYEIVIQSRITGYIPFTTKYIEDSNLESGMQKTTQNGANGIRSEAYRIVKLNGNTISTTLLSKDTYNPTQKVVVKGIKGVTVVETPAEKNNNTKTQTSTNTQAKENNTTVKTNTTVNKNVVVNSTR